MGIKRVSEAERVFLMKNIDSLIYEIDCKKNGDLEVYRISV